MGSVGARPQSSEASGEEEDAAHVEALAADAVGDPAADGQHHGVGDQVAGEDPGGFFGAGGERAADVGHGDVGDGGVERLHEGGEGDGDGDGPGIGAGSPRVVKCGCRRGGQRLVLSGLRSRFLPPGQPVERGSADNRLTESGLARANGGV